jgi:hypothetical protein
LKGENDMGKKYFTKKGFEGLTTKSKLICVGIFLGVSLVAWPIASAILDFNGIIVALIVGAIVAAIAQEFLPRDSYFYTEYFCADCGQYLGYSPVTCTRCGCNRYTTEDSGVGRSIRSR